MVSSGISPSLASGTGANSFTSMWSCITAQRRGRLELTKYKTKETRDLLSTAFCRCLTKRAGLGQNLLTGSGFPLSLGEHLNTQGWTSVSQSFTLIPQSNVFHQNLPLFSTQVSLMGLYWSVFVQIFKRSRWKRGRGNFTRTSEYHDVPPETLST